MRDSAQAGSDAVDTSEDEKLELLRLRFASIEEKRLNGELVDGEALFQALDAGAYD